MTISIEHASESELRLTIAGEDAMVAFGEQLGRACKASPGDGVVVFLEGDLGAGKTTVSRGVLRGFGHQGAVKSPTYTLVEPYEFTDGQVYHFDLYRLGDPEELEYMGIRDYFGAGHLCLVEWPKRGDGFLPRADVHVVVTVSGRAREVRVLSEGNVGRQVVKTIRLALHK